MVFSYYPGCTLKTKAKELDQYARSSAEALGCTLEEIPEWQCCGGMYPMVKDEIATKLSSVRVLVAARDAGQELVTVCSACHNVVKLVNNDLKTDADITARVNNYLNLDVPYTGETKVIHYLEMLRDTIGFDNVAKKVVKPFTGKKIGAYYGCLLLRPSNIMQMDNQENPKILEDFIRAIGGTPVIYAMRNECCGGYMTIEDKDLANKKSGAVLANASDAGAEILITACPLCLYNLNQNTDGHDIPVAYFTELLAEALGLEVEKAMSPKVEGLEGDGDA
jgi:heterodisulfide reductase subunit B